MDLSPSYHLLELARLLQHHGLNNIAVTPETHRRVNARPENALATDLRGVFHWSRPFDRSILPQEVFERAQAANALAEDGPWWRSRYRLSMLDGLHFLHSAHPTEAEDSVFFGPDTYRFVAAVTQELISTQHVWGRAADIGCGSGAAGIHLACLNSEAAVVATDINRHAVDVARINAQLARTPNTSFHLGNLLDGVEGGFDLIVANPPYLLDAKERLYRHGGGAYGEAISLRMLETALARLNPKGRFLLYTGSAIVDGVDLFKERVAQRLATTTCDWSYRELDPDVFGEELATLNADRIAAVFLSVRN